MYNQNHGRNSKLEGQEKKKQEEEKNKQMYNSQSKHVDPPWLQNGLAILRPVSLVGFSMPLRSHCVLIIL